MKTKHNDGLEWLREIRRKMAAKFDHDPRKAAAYYQKMQRRTLVAFTAVTTKYRPNEVAMLLNKG